jgi:hypothetical protein
MPATIRPTLTMSSYSRISNVHQQVVSTTLQHENTVNPADPQVNAVHMELPQRADYFQPVIEIIGANINWHVMEILMSVKARGMR